MDSKSRIMEHSDGCGDGDEGGMKGLAGEAGRDDQFMGSALGLWYWQCL